MMPTRPNGSLKLTNTTLIDCGSHRISSRSVSWNATGSFLAMACSDRVARICTVETSASAAVREVLTVSGHTAAVTKVRFHPHEPNQLCTAAADKSVRLWDVRGASQRAMGRIELNQNAPPVAVEWSPTVGSNHLVVMERTGISIYDTRKLNTGVTAATSSNTGRGTSPPATNAGTATVALATFPTKKSRSATEMCLFSPDGKYLVADESMYGESSGYLRVWSWEDEPLAASASDAQRTRNDFLVPSHTPIYAMQFSPDGQLLATGGCDATVGVWDVETMCCSHTVSRHTKFIRSVAFSHDSQILASSTEEGVDLTDSQTSALIGMPSLGPRPRSGGAEEISFHPKEYLLACARTDTPMGPPPSPLVVMKLSISASQ